jgi:hypothetical protein
MTVRIRGCIVETVLIDAKRCRLLDIDKKNREAHVLQGTMKKWVPFSEVWYQGSSLASIGLNHIRVSPLTGAKKSKSRPGAMELMRASATTS